MFTKSSNVFKKIICTFTVRIEFYIITLRGNRIVGVIDRILAASSVVLTLCVTDHGVEAPVGSNKRLRLVFAVFPLALRSTL